MAFYSLEPWGPTQEDLRAGYIASLIYGSSHKAKSAPQHMKPSDFFPSLKEPVVEADDDPEMVKAMLQGLALAMGGTVK